MGIRVARNAALNVLGVILPTAVGIVAVPVLLRNLGEDRLGIFTLAVGLIGFAGVFDLGLGRSLTQTVASASGRQHPIESIADSVRRTLITVALMGGVWGSALWLTAVPLVNGAFEFESDLAAEAARGIRWLAAAIPALLLCTAMAGALEGLQRFALANTIRVPLGVLSFLVPAFVSFWSQDVGHVIAALALVRVFAVLPWLWAVTRAMPILAHAQERLDHGAMWRFTAWLTVSNIVGPLMVHADRFYLASLYAPAAVARYTVPLDTLLRGTALPLAGMNALFPALAHAGASNARTGNMVFGASCFMLLLWSVPIGLLALMLRPILELWVGIEFAAGVMSISKWLLLGVTVNGFAHIPYALLHSGGRSDLTGRLHLIELPIYASLLVVLVAVYGVVGAALAWTARIAIDTVSLYSITWTLYPGIRRQFVASAALMASSTLIVSLILFAWTS